MREVAKELHSTVDDWYKRLAAITDETASERRYHGAWSSKEILGHLTDSAANNHQRFVRGQFVDYLDFPDYQQEQWVRSQAYHERRWADIVELWRHYNLHLAHVLSHFLESALLHTCKVGDREPVTLEFLATDYLDHMRHHLEQIAEGVRAVRS